MYKQVLDPVGDSLGLTSIFAAIPIVVLFVLLGGLKMKAHWASLIALAIAIVVAIAVYSMPVGQALDAGLEGAAFGIFPIMCIVFIALWIYSMTVDTGYFAVLRRAFNRGLRRPARPGSDHRLLLRRAAGGARRLRHARRDHRVDADGPRHQADQGGLDRAGLQHRAGGLRRDRHPDRHAVARSRACRRTTSARWSGARRRCWRWSCR